MMYSAYKLNKQDDNLQPWHTPFPNWNQSVVSCPVLTVASWPAYRCLKRQVRWPGVPISLRIFQSLLWPTQSKAQPLVNTLSYLCIVRSALWNNTCKLPPSLLWHQVSLYHFCLYKFSHLKCLTSVSSIYQIIDIHKITPNHKSYIMYILLFVQDCQEVQPNLMLNYTK